MPDLCAYRPCRCMVETNEIFCSDVCAMLGAGLVNAVKISSTLPLAPDARVTPRCACAHEGCGDSLISGSIN